MDTGKTTRAASAGSPARLTRTCSSSPPPSPVRLSPVCWTAPSGVVRLLKNTKCLSLRTLPSALQTMALASRSNALPSVVRASQPSPTTTAVSPGAAFVSETLPPLVRLTLIVPPFRRIPRRPNPIGAPGPDGPGAGSASVLTDDREVVELRAGVVRPADLEALHAVQQVGERQDLLHRRGAVQVGELGLGPAAGATVAVV